MIILLISIYIIKLCQEAKNVLKYNIKDWYAKAQVFVKDVVHPSCVFEPKSSISYLINLKVH